MVGKNETLILHFLNMDISLSTVNIEIFAQYKFSCISHRALDARKFDVSENS